MLPRTDPVLGTQAGARRGFTLIELLVVIAIIAILAALLLPDGFTHTIWISTNAFNAIRDYSGTNMSTCPSLAGLVHWRNLRQMTNYWAAEAGIYWNAW